MSALNDADAAAIQSALDTTRHRDPAEVAVRLEHWLASHGGGRVVRLAAPAASGASSELFLADLFEAGVAGPGEQPVVLRLIGEHAVYPHVDPEMQFLCQRLMNVRSAAPVPRALAFEPSSEMLDAPFILMARSGGRGAPDWPSYVREGWIKDLSPEDRAHLWDRSIAAIATLHATDLAGIDTARLSLPGDGPTPIDRLVAYWRFYLSVVGRPGEYPALDTAVAWLEREKPEISQPACLLWGDASLRNMLFEGLEPVALLDLEFAHVGIPDFDIAFFAMMDRVMAEGYAGTQRLTGFPEEAETFDRYEVLSGRALKHRDYFQRMAVTYMALANTRVFQRLAAEGRMAVADVGRNPPLRFLGGLFGMSV